SSDDTLRIRDSSSGSFVDIVVTSGGVTAKGTIVSDLNTGFGANGLSLQASISGTNQVLIVSTTSGVTSYVEVHAVGSGSTLSTAIGYAAGGVTSASAGTTPIEAAVYPTSTTIDVSAATITAVGDIADLPQATQDAIVTAIADLVAPQLSETSL